MDTDVAINEFAKLCFQFAEHRTTALTKRGAKFAHYTTAENALNILRGKTLWLRNASLMNDFSEIDHGVRCMVYCLRKTDHFQRLATAVDLIHPGIVEEIVGWLAERETAMRLHTYMSSISEHEANDELGRLSMWRAYGGPTAGVALVFNTDFLDGDSEAIEVYGSPVLYGDEIRLATELGRIVRNIETNLELMALVPKDRAKATILNAFLFAILSTKHPGFEEEREWRLIHSPYSGASDLVKSSVETIGGIPQIVHKLPLGNIPGMPMVELPLLLHRVLIGPCEYPNQIAQAFHDILASCGIANPRERISVSEIPLRRVG